MFADLIGSNEIKFFVDLGLALLCGLLIGAERELKGKPAGISTQTLVITGAMLFTFMSHAWGMGDGTRIAAQVVSGIGFLGAGVILKSKDTKEVDNLTTAASIWYAAAIGMALGFNFHVIAVAAAVYAVLIARIPNLPKRHKKHPDHDDT
ncbi:MAG TPA: MgtC/SapB family protein [Candidatus Saccharimonadales bacterium]|nr:MgtC/SapB family protein [Candidatus Saccharimonadales bacterium]